MQIVTQKQSKIKVKAMKFNALVMNKLMNGEKENTFCSAQSDNKLIQMSGINLSLMRLFNG